jgi:hypothetical protein
MAWLANDRTADTMEGTTFMKSNNRSRSVKFLTKVVDLRSAPCEGYSKGRNRQTESRIEIEKDLGQPALENSPQIPSPQIPKPRRAGDNRLLPNSEGLATPRVTRARNRRAEPPDLMPFRRRLGKITSIRNLRSADTERITGSGPAENIDSPPRNTTNASIVGKVTGDVPHRIAERSTTNHQCRIEPQSGCP